MAGLLLGDPSGLPGLAGVGGGQGRGARGLLAFTPAQVFASLGLGEFLADQRTRSDALTFGPRDPLVRLTRHRLGRRRRDSPALGPIDRNGQPGAGRQMGVAGIAVEREQGRNRHAIALGDDVGVFALGDDDRRAAVGGPAAEGIRVGAQRVGRMRRRRRQWSGRGKSRDRSRRREGRAGDRLGRNRMIILRPAIGRGVPGLRPGRRRLGIERPERVRKKVRDLRHRRRRGIDRACRRSIDAGIGTGVWRSQRIAELAGLGTSTQKDCGHANQGHPERASGNLIPSTHHASHPRFNQWTQSKRRAVKGAFKMNPYSANPQSNAIRYA